MTESGSLQEGLHDPLTQLPGAALLRDRLQQAIIAAQRDNTDLALLLLRLDRFAEIVTDLGVETADSLLESVAVRARSSLRESDTVARLGDDNFAVLLPRADRAGAALTGRKLFTALERPHDIDGRELTVRPEMGVALYPQHGRDAAALLLQAEVAIQDADRESLGYMRFATGEDNYRPKHQVLSDDLRQAIEYNELLLTYQPKVDLRTGSTAGVEALLYWDRPRFGFVSPEQFIPLAEQSGLMKSLSGWVLNEALRQASLWYGADQGFPIAINLSGRDLHDPQLIRSVEKALTVHAIAPAALEVEIAEGAIMADPIRAMRVITGLHQIGIGVLIDDFGTGYSSLVHLAQLPVSQIKIDRSLVTSMTVNKQDALVVRTAIGLAHNLGIKVVAEGVETRESWEALRALGCDLAQGYFLSSPLTPDEVPGWSAQPLAVR